MLCIVNLFFLVLDYCILHNFWHQENSVCLAEHSLQHQEPEDSPRLLFLQPLPEFTFKPHNYTMSSFLKRTVLTREALGSGYVASSVRVILSVDLFMSIQQYIGVHRINCRYSCTSTYKQPPLPPNFSQLIHIKSQIILFWVSPKTY